MRIARGLAAALRLRSAVVGLAMALATGPAAAALAFERTEVREPCAHAEPLRQVFFGDTHVHTAFSFDASALGVRATPRDAYRFARGAPLALRPFDVRGRGSRRVRLERPLDFAVVTDHAELLGEVDLCHTPGSPGYGSLVCTLVRRWPLLAYYVVSSAIFNETDPERFGFCGADGAVCRDAALGPWREIQRAAEEAYDRSAACRFTSFVGYEWSGNPDSNMIHRNVVFRNQAVQERPSSYLDGGTAESLWAALESECLERGDGCDVIAIPHNPNVSGGWLFRTETPDGEPVDARWARTRARLERLVEVTQHKGASECRVSGTSEDELCDFERLPFATLDEQPVPWTWSEPPVGSYVREVLAEGLVQGERLGVNPFRLGMIGSTDTHEAVAGLVSERDFPGHAAGGDTWRLQVPVVPDHLRFNPGGLAAVWAEENSRDALFEAMRRRETYGTSGPRLRVRLFAGFDLPDGLCQDAGAVATAYARGVPMGGVLSAASPDAALRLYVDALRDPGTDAHPGGLLQRVQVVKIWTEDGRPRERVIEVAGDPESGASVDPDTCTPRGDGAARLCRVWTDPDFDPETSAVYYARVLENPSCRWTGHLCARHRVRCGSGDVPDELAFCCDGDTPLTVQERAWTSPVWVAPGGNGPG